EEAAAGVFRVGEAAGGDDERGPAEQVAQLDDDEDEEQQVDEAQRGGDGNDAERQPAFRSRSGQHRADQRPPEVSRDETSAHGEHDDVRQERIEVYGEGIRDQRAEHGVGGGEQASEHDQYRE